MRAWLTMWVWVLVEVCIKARAGPAGKHVNLHECMRVDVLMCCAGQKRLRGHVLRIAGADCVMLIKEQKEQVGATAALQAGAIQGALTGMEVSF
mmetsp:Transcript_58839/g.97242  ORF Transcript_58839/g.97242 Transcript_58839/m.97242 type:complete len:94 (+) Transcript_58839:428-709(+)